MALHQAVDQARRVTGDFVHDFYERRIFDPYLSFASPEEEQAYRDREEARQRAIEAARALGTPEGDLLALRLGREQLEDAARYGADESPAYAGVYAEISSAERDLRAAVEPEQRQRSTAALEDRDTTSEPLVSPDVLASLRNAGVTMTDPNASSAIVPNSRPPEPGRSPA